MSLQELEGQSWFLLGWDRRAYYYLGFFQTSRDKGMASPSMCFKLCLSTYTFCYQDRTYEELDLLFAKKTSARKFEGMHIDAYADVRRGSED